MKKAPPARKRKLTVAQLLLRQHLRELGFEQMTQEYQFMPGRKWRFDLADMERHMAFECNGGKWSGGHRRGKAIEDENEKLNTATLLGWRVLQFTNQQIESGYAKSFISGHLQHKLAQH